MDKNDPDYGKPTHQALAAQETFALYKWWKEERPKRPDPIDASGWSDFCEKRRQAAKIRGDESWCISSENESDEDKELSRKILVICHNMEQEQTDEDTAIPEGST